MATSNSVLEELVKAGNAGEPGDVRVNEVVSDGNGAPPAVVGSLESAGYTYIYDSKTGQRSLTNNNMLRTQLEKKRPDGSRVFTVRKPDFEPAAGALKCLLHPDQPSRPHFDALGMPTCRKSNLTSSFQVEQHMAHRHKVEWATIKHEQAEVEKAEQRDFQRAIMSAGAGKAPMYRKGQD